MITVTLPWPDSRLSPNARVHWRVAAELKKAARTVAGHLTFSVLQDSELAVYTWPDTINMRWTFNPPSRRRYDRDNLIAQHKASQDGIADALGVDDSRFVPTYEIGEVCEGGKVIVEIGERT